MSKHIDPEEHSELQLRRMEFAMLQLDEVGVKELVRMNDTTISFIHNGHKILFFPYTGWATGKGIKDGRGLRNLLNQLK
jgi:hypothetical protein